jgi:hypothetical protein
VVVAVAGAVVVVLVVVGGAIARSVITERGVAPSRCSRAGRVVTGFAVGVVVVVAAAGAVEPAAAGGATARSVITPLLVIASGLLLKVEVPQTRCLAGGWLPFESSRLFPWMAGCVEPGGYTGPSVRPTLTIPVVPGCGGAAGGRTGTQFIGG